MVADAMSTFAFPACKTFQDVSTHGSAEAREDVKIIIVQKLAGSTHRGDDSAEWGREYPLTAYHVGMWYCGKLASDAT